MKTLSVNISHNSSIAVYSDENKKIELYREENRYNKTKQWIPSPNNCSFLSYKDVNFDKLVFTSADSRLIRNSDEQIITSIAKNLNQNSFQFDVNNHHVYHAICGFYFSGFDEACCITIDGGGSQNPLITFQEFENIFYIDKNNLENIYKHCSNVRFVNLEKQEYNSEYFSFIRKRKNFTKNDYIEYLLSCGENNLEHTSIIYDNGKEIYEFPKNYYIPVGMSFNLACELFGFANIDGDAGKVMAMAGYDSLQSLNHKGFNVVSEWLTQQQMFDMSKNCQNQLFEVSKDLVLKASKISKNIILSGGCALNCVNNFLLVKEFPDLNFFVDPVAHDGGTAIGSAIYFSEYENNYKRIRSS